MHSSARFPLRGLLLAAVFLMAGGLAVTRAAAAATIYVDKDGRGGACSDSRDRTTAQNPATPVCSIERGMALAQAGDVVLVRGATFVRSGTLNLTKANVTLKAFPGELVKIDFSGASTGNGVNLYADGLVLEGFEITNAPEEGVDGSTFKYLVVRGNHIHHCGLIEVNGKYQNGIAGYGLNLLIEQNLVHDTGSHNIYVYGTGTIIRNNVIYKTLAPAGRGSYAITLGTPGANVTNVVVSHNIIAESINRSGIVFYSTNGASVSNVAIVNNVFLKHADNPVYVYDDLGTTFSGVQVKNNISAENGGNCIYFTSSGSCSTPPSSFSVSGNQTLSSASAIGFRNLGARDYYPAATSVLLNAALAGYANNDYLGVARPQGSASEIGPYEFVLNGISDVTPPAAVLDLR